MTAKKAAEETSDETPKKSRFGKKRIIFLLLVLLLLGGGGYAAWYMLLAPEGTSLFGLIGGNSSDNATPAAEAQPLVEKGPVVNVDPFLVNLADPLGRRYIKLTMDVEVRSSDDVKNMELYKPKVRDAVLMLLASKTFEDISTTEGKIMLKNEITNRINQILGGPQVIQVYFTDMVIQ